MRESLSEGEFLISLNFSENYAFIAQDAAQSFHYNNNQCSLATIVIYYKGSESKIVHKSMVVFSDSLIHDVVAVYLIQEIIINFLKKTFDLVRKVIYFTDGAAQHFKINAISKIFFIIMMILLLMRSGIFMQQPTEKMHVME